MKKRPIVADDILVVPVKELVSETTSAFIPNERAPRRTKTRFEVGPAALYAGHEKFLVRTALIRAQGYENKKGPALATAEDVAALVQHLTYSDQEHMVVLPLNSRMELLAIFEIAIGGTSSAQVEVAHALKVPLLVSAPACIIVHNHPSGRAEFSHDDVIMTARLKDSLDCIGVKLLDHVLIARDGFVSYALTRGAP